MTMSIQDNQQVDTLLDKIARTATATSAWLRTGHTHFERALNLNLGAWTDGVHTYTAEVSNDGSAVLKVLDETELVSSVDTDVSVDGEVIVSDATRDDSILHLDVLHYAEYFRIVQTVTGGPGTGLVSGAEAISAGPRHAGGQGQPASILGMTRNNPSIIG